jgi:predicted permease
MNEGPGMPRHLLALLSIAVPSDRRDEVLEDLEAGLRRRSRQVGVRRAKRYLYREVASLFLWRLWFWRGAALTRDAAGATTLSSSVLGRDVVQDVRFGARTLARRPGFTATAVLVLGLGIGAPTTVLTVVSTLFFQKPAHIAEPDRIIRLTRSWAPGEGGGALANPDYLHYRENASTLAGLAAYGGDRAVSYTTDGRTNDQLQVLFVSDNFFDLLGVPMARGRGFLPEENATPGTHPVVVLNHAFWIRSLGGDPDVVGRTLILNGASYRVVGIATEGFGSVSPASAPPDAWVPIAMYGALTRAGDSAWWERLPNWRTRWLQVLGRLAPGVTFEAARANLVALGEALEYEGKSEGEGVFVQRQFLYSPRLEATLASLSRMLLVVVVLVLLVAAFNAAVLLLSRATTRSREIGIRTALGAGKGRITRQILVETLLLGGMGGALGLALAYGLSGMAASLLPVPFAVDFHPDIRVVLLTVGISLLTAVTVGLLPALHASRNDVRGALQSRGPQAEGSRGRNALVAGQVGLSLILVAGAFLFGRSFWEARTQDVGFATDDRLVLRVNLWELDLGPEERNAFLRQALDRIRALPGVLDAAITRQIPFQGDWTTEVDAPPGATPNYEGDKIFTGMNAVSGDYFQVAGISILQGRPVTSLDVLESAPVIVVSEALARAVWPGESPLGRTLPLGDDQDFEVVGVARDANYYELGEAPQPQAYLSVFQAPSAQRSPHFLIHTSGAAAEVAPVVQEALREMEPRLVFGWVTTMASVFEDEIGRYKVSAVLVTVFSAIALLLAAAGLYGTVSFLVARRTREIGVRMALGADRGRVAGEVLRYTLRLVAAGVVMGLVGVLVLRRFTVSLLYSGPPDDALPLLGAAIVLLIVAGLATLAPARRATQVDPMEAIRAE